MENDRPFESPPPFEYVGRVWVRPVGRGIILLDPPIGSPIGGPDRLTELDPQHGMYMAELRFIAIGKAGASPYDDDEPGA